MEPYDRAQDRLRVIQEPARQSEEPEIEIETEIKIE